MYQQESSLGGRVKSADGSYKPRKTVVEGMKKLVPVVKFHFIFLINIFI